MYQIVKIKVNVKEISYFLTFFKKEFHVEPYKYFGDEYQIQDSV